MKKAIITILMVCSTLIGFSQTELTDENAEAKLLVNNDRLIVLDFYATWCGPCKRMEPILKELESEYYGSVDFYKIDVDKSNVDDALGISAMPTYLFIKNSDNLEQIEGAMSKEEMKSLIKKHMGSSVVETAAESENDNFDLNDFSQKNLYSIWDSSSQLNSLAWNAYQNHNDITVLLTAIKAVERSIELEKTYYNVDTHAALLFKTGSYQKALKKAKEAINIAKEDNIEYTSTTDLIEKIIDRL